MKDDELRQLLEELHQKIETADLVDEKGRELLDHLRMDIDHLLERTGQKEQPDAGTWQPTRWEDSIRYFEVTHPNLTAALSHMLNILNNAGI